MHKFFLLQKQKYEKKIASRSTQDRLFGRTFVNLTEFIIFLSKQLFSLLQNKGRFFLKVYHATNGQYFFFTDAN
uniref:Uncharacterized protein n=1 Tax=Anguilla anguilla TaxID=7936 RepID=A0A0E9WLU2_ANGAN